MNIKYTLATIILVVVVSACKTPQVAVSSSDPSDHIQFLSSELLAGRSPSTKGDSLSAYYIRDKFISYGLKTLYDDGFQKFPVVTGVYTGKNNRLKVNGLNLVASNDFQAMGFSGNNKVISDVVFSGYGFKIDDDSIKWDDYKNIDVKGKWVLAFRMDPDLDNIQSPFAMYGQDRYKAMIASDMGAAGLLLVNTTEYEKDDILDQLRAMQGISPSSIPVIQVTRKTANHILTPSGFTVDSLEKIITKTRKPKSFKINSLIDGETDIKPNTVNTMNVAALVKGRANPHEYLIVGAHYDHLGMGGPETSSRRRDTIAIHPGADDNASGIAALLKMAKKVSKTPLSRSVIFVAFGAEESGLLGSRYFVEKPPVTISSVKAMINFDMVGRLDTMKSLSIGGTGTALELEGIIDANKNKFGFNIKKNPEGTGPSDHSSFYTRKVPVLFFTTGVHDQYHTPEDKAGLINYEGIDMVVDYSLELITEIANSEKALTFNEVKTTQPNISRRRLKATLGIIPDFSSGQKGVGVDGVRPGGPAHKGGILKGDLIIGINGNSIENIYDYMFRLAKHSQGERIALDIIRDNKTGVILIDL